ncbi:MAG: hypothetical protein KAU14_07510, partial [Thermoplasmata archaeon]|nr:hypothetical protein [Thermoplasmata archaeon]
GLDGDLIDISGIDNTTYTSIKLKAVFNSSEPGGASLDYWCIRWTGAPGAWGDYFTRETTVSFDWKPLKSGDTNITVQLVSPDDEIDGNNNITRFVTVPEAPEFEIYPNKLSVSMKINESITRTIRLKNNGNSSLNWSLGEKIKSSVKVAILNYGSKPSYLTGGNDNLYSDYSNALSSDERITRDVVTSLDSATISGYNTIILPDNAVPDSNLDDVEARFVPGKTIICVDSAASYAGYSGFMWPDSEGSNGYDTYWTYGSLSNDQKVVLEHRITRAYNLSDILNSRSSCARMYENKLEPNTVVFTESNSDSTKKYIAGRNVEDGGSIIVLGPMPRGLSLNQLYPLIRETCFGLEGGSPLPDWLNFSSSNGTLDPNEEVEIELTFNSTGMDPGKYDETISFELEGGNSSMENLTIEFEVLRPLHDLALEHLSAPGPREAGKPVTVNVNIANHGRSDEQGIKVNFSVDGKSVDSKIVPFLQEAPNRIESSENVTLMEGDALLYLARGEILFEDFFPTSPLNTTKWPGSSYSGMSSTYHSSPYSCNLDSSEHIDSMTINLSKFAEGYISFFYRRAGIDNGEYMRLYYYSTSSSWAEIWNV